MNLFGKNYAKLMIIPLVLMVIFLLLIIVYPGIEKGIDLKGGNQIIVHYDDQKDFSQIEPKLKKDYSISEVKINETKNINQYGLLIEFSLQPDIEQTKTQRSNINFDQEVDAIRPQAMEIANSLKEKGFLEQNDLTDIQDARDSEELKQALTQTTISANNNFNSQVLNLVKSELNLTGDDVKIQIREVAPTLGKDFVKSSTKAGIIAFALLIIVILLFFRQLIPSGLIIFAAIFDILAALAGMAIFDLSLSLTTIPALLMLIGYSVDTDIMLSARILKDRHTSAKKAANESIKTGLTMTITTMSTVLIMLIISYLAQIVVIYEISIILLCGLIGDVISTWAFNAPALIKFAEKKYKH